MAINTDPKLEKVHALKVLKAAMTEMYPQLSEEAWDFLSKSTSLHKFQAKELIIKADEVQKNIYFLVEGLVRAYYIDDQGAEISVRFTSQKGWLTHYSALLQDKASSYLFQASESSTVIGLPYAQIKEGYQKFKGLEYFGRIIAERILISQQKRIESFQFQSAEQRYLNFIEEHPLLFNRISLSHLSTFLGIKRQSLTRIRKKLSSRK